MTRSAGYRRRWWWPKLYCRTSGFGERNGTLHFRRTYWRVGRPTSAALPLLESARIPRWCGVDAATSHCELHGFADASSRAYAAVVYARIVRREAGPARVTLLVAKTRVAPVRTVSIPRLELCAAALLARLLHRVASEAPWPPAGAALLDGLPSGTRMAAKAPLTLAGIRSESGG